MLGQTKPFLNQMVFSVRDLMRDAYPELNETVGSGFEGGACRGARFAHTLDVGLEKLEALLDDAKRGFDQLRTK